MPAYAKAQGLPARLQRMVALTRAMEFVTTASEVEALLLEANLIKRYRPPFNIVLRDDKSFPYIFLRTGHEFPLIGKHRGAKRPETEYFGPFASAGAVNDTLNALLKAFPLRSCRDSIFASRTRPCLQYQIKRCSAPCVGRIGAETYGRIVAEVREFLSGKSDEVQTRLQGEMLDASGKLDFERAAVLRDRLKAMAHIQARQGINTEAVEDADVVAGHQEGGQVCVQVFFYRAGRNYGNRAYYPAHTKDATSGEILAAFLAQFYAERVPARLVLLVEPVPEQALLAEALAVRAGRKVELLVPRRGGRRQLVEIALTNARQALARRLADTASQEALLEQLADRFDLPETPARVEVYDNSHIQGSNAIGAFIVAGPEGFDKRSYRTFNIKGGELAAGDDYAMMREVLQRRFARLIKEDPERTERELARAGGHRRRCRAARRRPGRPGRARPGRPAAARGGQGSRAQRRPGAVLPARPRAPGAGPARPGPLLCPAAARRGAPVRDPDPSREADARHRALGARSGPGGRRQAQARAAQPFRLGPRRVRGRRAGSGAGAGDRSGGSEGDP